MRLMGKLDKNRSSISDLETDSDNIIIPKSFVQTSPDITYLGAVHKIRRQSGGQK